MTVYEQIISMGDEMEQELVRLRRDFHRHPETGWLEMRTSAIIAEKLKSLGFEVLTGRAVCKEDARMGIPSEEELIRHLHTIEESDDEEVYTITDEMKEGFTGVVAQLKCGEGKVAAFRFDIDALPMQEDESEDHKPYKEGFSSVYPGMMHACGHDCHTAIGLGVAQILSKIKDRLHGTVRLLFQPAEEGTRGAYSMVKAGHLNQTDYFVGAHVSQYYVDPKEDLIPGSYGALATCKYKITFHGVSAHAGRAPEEGSSAVLAAAHAAVGLAGIARHSKGMSRVNIGSIHGGSGSNVVPDQAELRMEVRGETDEINEYMVRRTKEICHGAAAMEGCTCCMELMGHAPSQISDEALTERIADLVEKELPQYRLSSCHQAKNQDSEDAGFMMRYVQDHGGQAVYMRNITKMASPQHTVKFDVDESVLKKGVVVFSAIAADLLA